MATFRYRGIDERGMLTGGRLEAEAEADALAALRARGVLPMEIRRAPTRPAFELSAWTRSLGPLPLGEVAVFCRQLATMVRAGVPLLRAVRLLSERAVSGREVGALLADVAEHLAAGMSLAKAFAAQATRWPPGFVALIETGESSGTLDEVLARLAGDYERLYEQRQKMRSATLYPTLVAVLAFLLVLFLVTWVVPHFWALYRSLKAPVPGSTAFLFHVGSFLTAHAAPLAAAALAAASGCALAVRRPAVRTRLEPVLWRLPTVGPLLRHLALARTLHALATLLRSGVPVLEAMAIAERVAGAGSIAQGLRQAAEVVADGGRLAEGLRRTGTFPPLFLEMLTVGEETGSVDDMLERTAAFYDLEAEQAMARLATTLEPLLVVGLGVVVAFILISILIPMYSVFNLLGTGGG